MQGPSTCATFPSSSRSGTPLVPLCTPWYSPGTPWTPPWCTPEYVRNIPEFLQVQYNPLVPPPNAPACHVFYSFAPPRYLYDRFPSPFSFFLLFRWQKYEHLLEKREGQRVVRGGRGEGERMGPPSWG